MWCFLKGFFISLFGVMNMALKKKKQSKLRLIFYVCSLKSVVW